MYAPKPKVMQACNLYDCPKWVALEWSQCTVTCGHGLRYRVVLCIDHHGQHTGGCNPQLKLHIKEECIVSVPCYKPREKNPVEAKVPWSKQAHEMEESRTLSEEPTTEKRTSFRNWRPDSVKDSLGRRSCHGTARRRLPERGGSWIGAQEISQLGLPTKVREVKCRIYLAFTQTEVELPDEECEEPKPPTERSCHLELCDGDPAPPSLGFSHSEEADVVGDWEYVGFTPCSATCDGGMYEIMNYR
uniref:Uncharacterized protein n=1 Tax=Sphaerodactylus townsendi TaxID=933632 RepID=A0ACB8E5N7_9SAUR